MLDADTYIDDVLKHHISSITDCSLQSDEGPMDRDLYLHEFLPQPKLSVPVTQITRPRFPVIDAHNPLGPDFGGGWSERPVAQLIDALDQADVRVYVDLDGGWGEQILNQRLEHF